MDSEFTDPRDGQVYRTVKIGGLVWMAQNLNFKIENSWCYDNNEFNGRKYGRLYTWAAAKAACPKGWHLPSREEWNKLVEAAGGQVVAGKKLKSAIWWSKREDGTSGTGTDEFGFWAVPGGYRDDDDGIFYDAYSMACWWSAEGGGGNAYHRGMHYNYDFVGEFADDVRNGHSVRCVKDAEETFFTDSRDGQVYRTVKIGGLVWMAENLNFKIENSWCYDNNDANGKKYGRLYTWAAAKAACPKGWHLPSREEWNKLVEAVGGEVVAEKKLKSKMGWEDDGNGTDEFGFSALPGGGYDDDGSFNGANGYYGIWWSASEAGDGGACSRSMHCSRDRVDEYYRDVRSGYSVRCVMDVEETFFTDSRDGQAYRTVKIGGLVWMAENLNFKIENSWCYDNNEFNGRKYGRLYTWAAAKAACPKGWHLPSREEWNKLVEAAGGRMIAGKKLKSKTVWNDNSTDELGFSALPGGNRDYVDGSFDDVGVDGIWWSATADGSGEAYFWYMIYNDDIVNELANDLRSGFSVRCVLDLRIVGSSKDTPKGESENFIDPRDRREYRTVKIGEQIWLAENLNYVCEDSWCYDNDPANGNMYGRLYTWDAAKKACEGMGGGWRLPSNADWDQLVNCIGGAEVAGKKLKSRSLWKIHGNGTGTDDFGFSALPGGYSGYSGESFDHVGWYGRWWSATEHENRLGAYHRDMYFANNYVSVSDFAKRGGFSVRAVRDCGAMDNVFVPPPTPPVSRFANIFDAAKDGGVEDLRRCVESGADVNAKDDSGITPISMAAMVGKVENIKYIVALGANVNAKDCKGETPIFVAAQAGQVECIKCLVGLGADVNARDYGGATPMIWAAGSGQQASMECLAYLGADVNAATTNGMTPMLIAVATGMVASMKCLRDLGAKMDVRAQNGRGPTLMDIAIKNGHTGAAEWLRSVGMG